MKKGSTTFSDLICSECGIILTIPRKTNEQRHYLHIKDMYCIVCNKETKFVEVHDADLFKKKLEFKQNLTEREKSLEKILSKTKRLK